MSLDLLFLYLMLSMFRMLIHPFSGACDLCAELFHGSYCSVRIELISLYSTIKMMHGPINMRLKLSVDLFKTKFSTNEMYCRPISYLVGNIDKYTSIKM